MYYLQSRYYDASIDRFITADSFDSDGIDNSVLKWNIWAYCENQPTTRIDVNGCYWHQKYSGYKKTKVGFNVDVHISFLSRSFCLSYAHDFLKANGSWHWWYGRRYSGMTKLRIAQELWFHALVYYIGMPIKRFLILLEFLGNG